MSRMELSLRKSIFCDKDLNNFKSSTSYTDILDFVKVYIYNLKTDSIIYVLKYLYFEQLCATKIVGKTNASITNASTSIIKINQVFNSLLAIVDEIPPIKQPMRFGNKAFRTYYERIEAVK